MMSETKIFIGENKHTKKENNKKIVTAVLDIHVSLQKRASISFLF